jgi:hypothetical protein
VVDKNGTSTVHSLFDDINMFNNYLNNEDIEYTKLSIIEMYCAVLSSSQMKILTKIVAILMDLL